MAHIFSINRSNGGVPKLPDHEGRVGSLGLEGDRQNNTEHHGGPMRALCLFSLEVILELQAEGHRIFPGSTGENITVAGLNWSRLTPGSRLRLGDEVEIEITSYAAPCKKIGPSFVDGKFTRISQKVDPHKSRLYAKVHQGGAVKVTDRITLLPPVSPDP